MSIITLKIYRYLKTCSDDKCRPIILTKVERALAIKKRGDEITTLRFRLLFRTQPSNAFFGALLHRVSSVSTVNGHWTVLGNIERLDSYGKTFTGCIKDLLLERYCSCVNNTGSYDYNV